MNASETIRSWLDPEFRATLGDDAPAHPAGIVDLDEAGLSSIAGGTDELEAPLESAAGIFSTLFGSRKQTCCYKWKRSADGDAEAACEAPRS